MRLTSVLVLAAAGAAAACRSQATEVRKNLERQGFTRIEVGEARNGGYEVRATSALGQACSGTYEIDRPGPDFHCDEDGAIRAVGNVKPLRTTPPFLACHEKRVGDPCSFKFYRSGNAMERTGTCAVPRGETDLACGSPSY